MTSLSRHAAWWCALSLLGAVSAGAQTSPQTLVSVPGRAEFVLDGPVRVTGGSPLRLEEPLKGEFVLTATRPGFVEQKARLVFPEGGGPARPGGSSPVDGFSGAVRTLLIPGVGQWAGGQPGQGLALLLTEGVAVGYLFKTQGDIRTADQDYGLAQDQLQRFDGTVGGDPGVTQTNLVVSAARYKNMADDARAARKRWIALAGAAWAYSVIDQAFLRGGLEITTSGLDTLQVRLQPISRGQAVVRSLLVPGSGQGYAGHHARGAWLLVGGAALTAMSLAAEHHLDRTLSEQSEAELRVSELTKRQISDPALLASAYDQVQLRYSDAQSALHSRNAMWAMTGLLWGLNVIDAALMEIPGEGGTLLAGGRQGMYADIHPGEVRLGFRRGF